MSCRDLRERPWVRQALRFLLLTCASATISLGLPVILHEWLGVPPELGVAAGFLTAFIVNLTMLRRVVFSSDRSLSHDFVLFSLSTLSFRGAEYVAFLLLYSLVGINYVVALVLVLCISSAAKFLWYRSRWGTGAQ
jgi:putative flippase GtrA